MGCDRLRPLDARVLLVCVCPLCVVLLSSGNEVQTQKMVTSVAEDVQVTPSPRSRIPRPRRRQCSGSPAHAAAPTPPSQLQTHAEQEVEAPRAQLQLLAAPAAQMQLALPAQPQLQAPAFAEQVLARLTEALAARCDAAAEQCEQQVANIDSLLLGPEPYVPYEPYVEPSVGEPYAPTAAAPNDDDVSIAAGHAGAVFNEASAVQWGHKKVVATSLVAIALLVVAVAVAAIDQPCAPSTCASLEYPHPTIQVANEGELWLRAHRGRALLLHRWLLSQLLHRPFEFEPLSLKQLPLP